MKKSFFESVLLGFAICFAIASPAIFAEGESKPDNSRVNSRDQALNRETADEQMLNAKEVETVAAIRRQIVGNEELSTYGKNVKITLQNGSVVLRGPVRTKEEKEWIAKVAKDAAANYTVINELEVAHQ